jgi:Xaa-Pro aminopeptidase
VCRATLDVALAATRPGRRGWEVHEEACAHMESLGFRRDGHAMGHQIGRDEQDPGPWLGDRADLQRPADAAIEANMVVTLDPTMNRAGLDNPGGFAMGVEEMAAVGQNGAALLFPPQEEIYRVRFSH